jgi:flagellar biosynthesis/type III secretory pathway M-ring protein FliF/YscJ
MATTVSANSNAISTVLQNCSKTEGCNFTDLINLFQSVILFGIWLASLVVVFVLIKTGFKMITTGSPNELAEAKKSMTKVLLGYFFMLAGWLLVKTILTYLGVSSDYQMLAS